MNSSSKFQISILEWNLPLPFLKKARVIIDFSEPLLPFFEKFPTSHDVASMSKKFFAIPGVISPRSKNFRLRLRETAAVRQWRQKRFRNGTPLTA